MPIASLPHVAPAVPAARPARRPALLVTLLFALGALVAPAPAMAAPVETPTPPRVDTGVASLFAGQVQLRLVTGGLSSPLFVTNAGDGSGRLFVVQQGGTVRVVKNGVLQAGTFLNIASKISTGSERGLLGLAFHPGFAANRKLFVYYTRGDGDIVIAEYTANADLQSVPASSEDVLLTIEHSQYSNHNGGMLAFGPDGNLYAGVGDGGSSGDPFESGQNTATNLGKVLRIAPNLSGGYTIPGGNPFGNPVWAYGLRNPWRFSFDEATNQIWIADVGQNAWEEVNRQSAATAGINYGWDCREGKHWFETSGCDTTAPWPYTDPLVEYSHSLGCSVTGGYVYRGALFPDFQGSYVFGDYCSGRVWTVPPGGSSSVHHGQKGVLISSFGEGEDGEVYLTDIGSGRLYWVVAPPFTDIASSAFMFDIMWLEQAGITGGCGSNKFCPDANVTRGQMAAFLARALKLPAATKDYFTDDETSIFENDINRLAEAGITGGCATNRFCPNDFVKRDQMASFLARALELPPTSTDFFTDDEGNIHEAKINAIAKAGITGGCATNRYCPDSLVTRGQMAAFLRRAFG